MQDADKKQLLKLTPADLQRLPPGELANVKGLMQIRQALYDLLGAFPQDNVLPYFYSFSLTQAKNNALTANGTAVASIKISADSAFVATSARNATSGDLLYFPRTDASDRQLVNEAVHSSNFSGTAERPGFFAKPLLCPANTTLSFDLTDLSGAANEVYFTLSGYKVYSRR
ncbi:MAG: DUF930 domain-containing protein [Okeania sp. SIO3H1]|nr:DUF930 domain-containing protein [Okeania sp. SIO3H1]